MSPDANCDRYWSSKNFKIYRVFSAFGGLLDCFVLDIIVFLVSNISSILSVKRVFFCGIGQYICNAPDLHLTIVAVRLLS